MTMQDVQGLLERLLAEKEAASKRLACAIQDVKAAERVLALLEGVAGDGTGDTEKTADDPVHGTTTPMDIVQCRTQMDAAEKMARANGGLLHITPASKVIKAAGLSEAKISSITSTLHNRASASDDWEYAEPGTFRLVKYEQTQEPDAHTISQMEIAIIQDDERRRNQHSSPVA